MIAQLYPIYQHEKSLGNTYQSFRVITLTIDLGCPNPLSIVLVADNS